ncbi:raffinose/stachyose/melibiose transport system substrate-binding protein [Kribbella sp. VKM Ac-2527]|uniref:Raffinose/stachyose/melibiose transport system substrate-binding protein n=1 Tax=Kribbella caucasensis TaxID=2512215 RepID=A0A4R6KD61_9ACTN|nr:extracellular solute-binding protein [Kribbella sp. VKM Ac-2527]TDO47716.1 raffinose/stachyose/melibiose transport system substrate-binding protein [Kribbella sp. VKM Ac-2527]
MRIGTRSTALAVFAAGTLILSACSAGSLGSSDEGGSGSVSITYLTTNQDQDVKEAEQLAKDFTAKNPGITVKVETRPGGTEGDNIIKTRLSTGDMVDVFNYNTGSLFQAIAPPKNLLPIDDQPYIGDLDENFKKTVTADGKVYGAPVGGFMGGAVLYSIPVYTKLGLKVPTTWSEFMANNAKIKASGDGVAPVIQTYGETWTSQLFVLGDFHNVSAAEPDFADKYTKNEAKYATSPAAVKGFEHTQQVHDLGYENKDFASAKLPDGLKMLATGKGAHYPILSGVVANMIATYPDAAKTVGLFALPGDDAAKNGLTLWTPGGLYIPTTTTGDKLEAAKKFLAFVASPDGCKSQSTAGAPTGPYAVKGCELPADVPQAIKDMQPYLDKPGASSLALEFLSPVKGPSLEQITVEVGSGIRKAKDGAARYDEDVKKQAQQLGLAGW